MAGSRSRASRFIACCLPDAKVQSGVIRADSERKESLITAGGLALDFDNAGVYPTGFAVQDGNAGTGAMAGLGSTAGVDQQYAVLAADRRPVGMSADHRVETGGSRVDIEAVKIVKYIKEAICDFDDFGLSKRLGPLTAVHVSTNGGYRGDFREPVQNLRPPDVPGVHNPGHSLQGGAGGSGKVSVGI